MRWLCKLLAKQPEERYQSAVGLGADLDAMRDALAQGALPDEYALGSQDVPDRFQIPNRLYGRETIRVNSLHGQGVQQAGSRVVIEGEAEDGTVEAIRISDASAFAMAVQWHAEYDPQTNPINRVLFEAFGDRAQRVEITANPD